MGWVKPIDQIEADMRYKGVFMLFDPTHRRLQFFGFKKDQVSLNKVISQLDKSRVGEMVIFLTARARAKGEK